jgi:putative oxidoreductase
LEIRESGERDRGLMQATGFRARTAAIVLALFLISVTAVFHGFWRADTAHIQDQLTQFLKNLAILGGMLLVIEHESTAADLLHIVSRSAS